MLYLGGVGMFRNVKCISEYVSGRKCYQSFFQLDFQ